MIPEAQVPGLPGHAGSGQGRPRTAHLPQRLGRVPRAPLHSLQQTPTPMERSGSRIPLHLQRSAVPQRLAQNFCCGELPGMQWAPGIARGGRVSPLGTAREPPSTPPRPALERVLLRVWRACTLPSAPGCSKFPWAVPTLSPPCRLPPTDMANPTVNQDRGRGSGVGGRAPGLGLRLCRTPAQVRDLHPQWTPTNAGQAHQPYSSGAVERAPGLLAGWGTGPPGAGMPEGDG